LINHDDFFASIVTTRYHRSYDGSFHISFKVDKDSQKFGVLIRYIDRFSHIALEFDFLSKKITMIRRSPYKGYESILWEMDNKLSIGSWHRIIIK